ncbi:reverse transcriptase domain-containing protein [Tanacetum coccineum]
MDELGGVENISALGAHGENSFEEMSITLFLDNFLRGFLVDDESLEAIFEEIKEDFEAGFLKFCEQVGLAGDLGSTNDVLIPLFEDEETYKMGKPTMEEYMTKTRQGYRSGIVRPKIDDKDQFELKGQFLKELRDNTFSGSDNEDVNEHIEKFVKIVDLFHIPNERFKELLLRCPQHYLMDMQEVILFYKGLGVPTRQILNSKGVIPSMKVVDAKKSIQEMAAQLNNLGREIKKVNEKVYAAQVGCELCKGPHYTKDCPLKEEGKTLEEAYYTQFVVHFNKEDNIEQQLQDSTKGIMGTLRIKSENKQWKNH